MGVEGDTSLGPEDWTELFRLMRNLNRNYSSFVIQYEAIGKKARERGFGAAWNEFCEMVREGEKDGLACSGNDV